MTNLFCCLQANHQIPIKKSVKIIKWQFIPASFSRKFSAEFSEADNSKTIQPRVRFGDPLTRTRSWKPGQRVAKTAWSSIHGYVTSQHFSPVNQILTFNKKATINLLKCLLGFKSILYLISSTQHTQACVFIKITVQNWFFFTSAVRDRWPGPRTKWKTRSSNRGTGVTRSWGPSRFSAWPGFGSQYPVMVRVAKTQP